ncbi:GNAT family N-acetyltransferase [Candidatus Woesearchaeota archaeon]|nr:GNAT family N-acetyltransferase [Candidatus Woesearchaeota archaeon]
MSRLVDRVIDDLRENGDSEIRTETSRFRTVLQDTVPASWDISLYDLDQIVGYVVVQKNEDGSYRLENQADTGYRHQGMKDGFGWGVEVHPNYRGRNIGKALLSIGIGLALSDFQEDCSVVDFKVEANGLGDSEEFYKKFGFEIESHDLGGKKPYITGKYTKQSVPDISISRKA